LGLIGLDFSKYIYLLCGKIVITERRKSTFWWKMWGFKRHIGAIFDW